ncbi:DNA polymerase III subunit psi, partial [Salmonella enterica subsp. enterica serovar Mbandaka]|nr:DNA polymerase III subunit psi [Salmonella enterica subsp. enterica serovar Mbandaka]
MLPQGSRCNSWRLGTDAPLQLEGAQVTTPAFNELRANPAARAHFCSNQSIPCN